MFIGTGTVDIVNTDGVHTFSLNDVTSPLNDFDVTVADRSDSGRSKPQQAGSWPTRSFEGAMTIHMEGALFADTSEDYVTSRKALLLALRGVPGTPVTDYRRGRLFFQPAGETERWYQDFGPCDPSIPVKGDFPALTEFLISVECFVPYFIGETSGDPQWWT